MAKKQEYNQFQRQQMKDVAEAIQAYLLQFEADPAANTLKGGRTRYLNPTAQASNRYVWIRYHSDEVGGLDLNLGQAFQYLNWLKSGHVGTYYEMIGKTPAEYHLGLNPDRE